MRDCIFGTTKGDTRVCGGFDFLAVRAKTCAAAKANDDLGAEIARLQEYY
jgi:hypothetical protein